LVHKTRVGHIVNASLVYDLPKLSGANAFVRHVLGNWQASAIESLRNGSMLTVVSSKGNSLAPGQATSQDRAQTVRGVNGNSRDSIATRRSTPAISIKRLSPIHRSAAGATWDATQFEVLVWRIPTS
jgi:hypothetical protein